MNQEMIGVQRAYFEKITGTPKYVDRNYRSYDLDGCKISIKESKSKSIESISLENISNKCTFDANQIFLYGPAHKLTFNSLIEAGYQFRAMETCIDGCGNIAEPTYGIEVWGPHAIGFIQFQGEYSWSTSKSERDLADRAAENFLKKLRRILKTDSYVSYEEAIEKIGLEKYTDIFISEFKNVKITSITLGHNILKD